MPGFYNIYPGNTTAGNTKEDDYLMQNSIVSNASATSTLNGPPAAENLDAETVSPFLSRDQVWDGQADLEIAIWNDLVGRAMTIQGFSLWLKMIAGRPITDILEPRFVEELPEETFVKGE